MLTVTMVLLVVALIFLIRDAQGKMASWSWGFVLWLILLLQVLPAGK